MKKIYYMERREDMERVKFALTVVVVIVLMMLWVVMEEAYKLVRKIFFMIKHKWDE